MKKLIMMVCCGAVMITLAACSSTTKEKNESANEPTTEAAASVNGEIGETAESGGIADKVPDPNVDPVEIVSIYTPNENGDRLKKQLNEIPEMDPQALVNLLAEAGVLDEGTTVLKFEIKAGGGTGVGPGMDGQGGSTAGNTATLDLSAIPSAGKKELILASVGNTFIENYELDGLTVLVSGVAQGEELSYYK